LFLIRPTKAPTKTQTNAPPDPQMNQPTSLPTKVPTNTPTNPPTIAANKSINECISTSSHEASDFLPDQRADESTVPLLLLVHLHAPRLHQNGVNIGKPRDCVLVCRSSCVIFARSWNPDAKSYQRDRSFNPFSSSYSLYCTTAIGRDKECLENNPPPGGCLDHNPNSGDDAIRGRACLVVAAVSGAVSDPSSRRKCSRWNW
jgi:hypothetical protein